MPISKDKAEKLIQLARRGVGGEATNAQAICERNGIEWRESKTEKAYQKGGRSTGGTGTGGYAFTRDSNDSFKRAKKATEDFYDGFKKFDEVFSKEARVSNINSRFELNIALIIARKLFTAQRVQTYEWDDVFKYAHFHNLSIDQHSLLSRIYKINKDRFTQAALRAASEAMEKLAIIH